MKRESDFTSKVRGHPVVIILGLSLPELGSLLLHGSHKVVPGALHALQLGSNRWRLEVVPLDHLLSSSVQSFQLSCVCLDLALKDPVPLCLNLHLPDSIPEGILADEAPFVGHEVLHLVHLGPEVLVQLGLLQESTLLPTGCLQPISASQNFCFSLGNGVGTEVSGRNETISHLHKSRHTLLLSCQSG